MEVLEGNYRTMAAGHRETALNRTLARSCIRKLLNHPAVARFLTIHHAGIHAGFTTSRRWKLVENGGRRAFPTLPGSRFSVSPDVTGPARYFLFIFY